MLLTVSAVSATTRAKESGASPIEAAGWSKYRERMQHHIFRLLCTCPPPLMFRQYIPTDTLSPPSYNTASESALPQYLSAPISPSSRSIAEPRQSGFYSCPPHLWRHSTGFQPLQTRVARSCDQRSQDRFVRPTSKQDVSLCSEKSDKMIRTCASPPITRCCLSSGTPAYGSYEYIRRQLWNGAQ
jgi:hypothetical protein